MSMKKKLFVVPLIALILASCNLTNQSSIQSKPQEESSFSFSSEEKTTSQNSSSSATSIQQSSSNSSSSRSSSSQSSSSNSSSSVSSSSSEQEDKIVNIELFALNDFHGNVKDSDTGLGISKTATLLKKYPTNVNNALYVSLGDMWQCSA